jgi:prevent-host-death family protein
VRSLKPRSDFVFDTGRSLWRVQCKSGAIERDKGVIRVNLTTSWWTPTGYAHHTYAAGEVDLFAVYCGEVDRCYLLRADGLAGRRAIYLRLSEPRNGQRACVNLASNFSFDGAVAQLGERRDGIAEARGSSPLSSTSSSAEVVAAHEFRERFGWYMERAAAGEVFEITRHGRPFVQITAAASIPASSA